MGGAEVERAGELDGTQGALPTTFGLPSVSAAKILAGTVLVMLAAIGARSLVENWREPQRSDPGHIMAAVDLPWAGFTEGGAALGAEQILFPEPSGSYPEAVARFVERAARIAADTVSVGMEDMRRQTYGLGPGGFESGRFGLFTGCAGVGLGFHFGPALFGFDDDGEMVPSDLREMGEVYLRAAGIWSGEAADHLSIAGDGSRAWFGKVVWDPLSGEFGGVRTWEIWPWQLDPARPSEPFDVTVAIGDGDPAEAALARDVVRAYLERFIGEYLRVNEDHC